MLLGEALSAGVAPLEGGTSQHLDSTIQLRQEAPLADRVVEELEDGLRSRGRQHAGEERPRPLNPVVGVDRRPHGGRPMALVGVNRRPHGGRPMALIGAGESNGSIGVTVDGLVDRRRHGEAGRRGAGLVGQGPGDLLDPFDPRFLGRWCCGTAGRPRRWIGVQVRIVERSLARRRLQWSTGSRRCPLRDRLIPTRPRFRRHDRRRRPMVLGRPRARGRRGHRPGPSHSRRGGGRQDLRLGGPRWIAIGPSDFGPDGLTRGAAARPGGARLRHRANRGLLRSVGALEDLLHAPRGRPIVPSPSSSLGSVMARPGAFAGPLRDPTASESVAGFQDPSAPRKWAFDLTVTRRLYSPVRRLVKTTRGTFFRSSGDTLDTAGRCRNGGPSLRASSLQFS